MGRTEVAVWSAPGELRMTGVVVKRGATAASKFTVRWDDGREEVVGPKDPVVRVAHEGSEQLRWLLDPDSFEQTFRADAVGTFVTVLRESGAALTAAKLQKAIGDLGIDSQIVKEAWEGSKLAVKVHRHVALKATAFVWSDDPVPTYDSFRKLTPEEALQRLLKPVGLKPEEKQVLAEVIRASFK